MEDITSESFKKKKVKVGIRLRERRQDENKIKSEESTERSIGDTVNRSALSNNLSFFSNKTYELLNAEKKISMLEEKIEEMERYFIHKIKIYKEEYHARESSLLEQISHYKAQEDGKYITDPNCSIHQAVHVSEPFYRDDIGQNVAGSISLNFKDLQYNENVRATHDQDQSNDIKCSLTHTQATADKEYGSKLHVDKESCISKDEVHECQLKKKVFRLEQNIESLEAQLEDSRNSQLDLLLVKKELSRRIFELESKLDFYKKHLKDK